MLPAKILRSSTFKLALIAIGIFGIVALALIGYVYWSTTSYVRHQTDHAIAAEQFLLKATYERGGRDGLVSAVTKGVADKGQVTVEVAHGAGGPLISVADHRPGIPVNERSGVFKHSYRLESSAILRAMGSV